MKKKLLALFLTLAMMLAMASALTLTAAVRPGEISDIPPTALDEALQGRASGVTVTAEKPYVPQHYTSGSVDIADLNPGDIVEEGVTLTTADFDPDDWLIMCFYAFDERALHLGAIMSVNDYNAEFPVDGGSVTVLDNKLFGESNGLYLAKTPDDYDLWVNGTKVSAGNQADVLHDGTVSYDPATHTLTLNGADIHAAGANPAIQCHMRDLTIRLTDGTENTVKLTPPADMLDMTFANPTDMAVINVMLGDLTITGNGTLNVELDDSAMLADGDAYKTEKVALAFGLIQTGSGRIYSSLSGYTACYGKLTVGGNASVNLKSPHSYYFDHKTPVSEDDEYDSYWIFAASGLAAETVILQNARLKTDVGNNGIESDGDLTITDSTVDVTADENGIISYGGSVIIADSTVDVVVNGGSGDGIGMNDFLIISGSDVDITAVFGIFGYSDAIARITGSKLNVSAEWACLSVGNLIINGGSQVTATGGSNALSCYTLTVEDAGTRLCANADVVEGDESGESYGLVLYSQETPEGGCIPASLNVTGGTAQFTGKKAGVVFLTVSEDEYELNGLTLLGSTAYDDFIGADREVTFESEFFDLGYCYFPTVGGELARSVQVSHPCVFTRQTALKEGNLNLRLNGREAGWFEFAEAEGGWKIRRSTFPGMDGIVRDPYLAVEDGKLVGAMEEDAAVWKYDARNGFYVTEAGAPQLTGFWFLFWYIPTGTRPTTVTYYLTSTENNAVLGTRAAATSFIEYVESTAHTPSRGYYVNLKNGEHQRYCTDCGEYYTEKCRYGENHRCVCGAYDPTVNPVTVEVTDKGWKTVYGWFWVSYRVYTVKLKATGDNARVTGIEYSMDGKNWKPGSTVTANAEINHFWIRVTDANGAVSLREYVKGEIIDNPVFLFDITLTTDEYYWYMLLNPDETPFDDPVWQGGESATYREIPVGTKIVVDNAARTVSIGDLFVVTATAIGPNHTFSRFLFNGEPVDDGTYDLSENLTITAEVEQDD